MKRVLRGRIILECQTPLKGAHARVTLADTSRVDAPARLIASADIAHIDHAPADQCALPFELEFEDDGLIDGQWVLRARVEGGGLPLGIALSTDTAAPVAAKNLHAAHDLVVRSRPLGPP